MELNPNSIPRVLHFKSRSNIYVLGELMKLIEILEGDRDNFESTLINQVAYFYILNPKDFASELVDSWLEIRNSIGYQDYSMLFNAEEMRNPIRAKINNFTKEDIDIFMVKLHVLKSRLLSEFRR